MVPVVADGQAQHQRTDRSLLSHGTPIIMHCNFCEQGQTLDEMCCRAATWGYDGIEFRRKRHGVTETVEDYLSSIAAAVSRSGLKHVVFGGPGGNFMSTDAAVRACELEEMVTFYRAAAGRFTLTVCNTMSHATTRSTGGNMTAPRISSLAATVDEVNEAFFFGRSLSPARRRRMAQGIAGRQGVAGSYAGLPAPTPEDLAAGLRVFTGERLSSRAGMAHVLGEEACRALHLLEVTDPPVQAALSRATQGMLDRLEKARQRDTNMGRNWRGEYCCARCTCALWRHLAVGGLQGARPDEWLDAGLANLRAHRVSQGRWRRFPFFYTLLALSEIESAQAVDECRHAAPACERALAASAVGADVFACRRLALAERILAKV